MRREFDTLINFFPRMKNRLTLHVTLEPSPVFCIAELVAGAHRVVDVPIMANAVL